MTIAMIVQVFCQVASHVQLSLSLQTLLTCTLCFGKYGLRGLIKVNQLIALLKCSQLALNATQFATNNLNTFVNKLSGVQCYAVFVFNHVFFISVIKRTQNVVCTIGIGIVYAKHNE